MRNGMRKNFLLKLTGLMFLHPRDGDATGGTQVGGGDTTPWQPAIMPGIGTAAGAVIGAGTSIISGILNNSESDRLEEKADERYDQNRQDTLKQQNFQNQFALAGAATSALQNQQQLDFSKSKEAYNEKTADAATAYGKRRDAKSDGLALLNQQLALNASQAAPFMGRK